MAGQIKTNVVQLGDSATATQNFVWQTNVDGTAKLARGNFGSTSQDILVIDASGNISLPSNSITTYTTATTPLVGSGTAITASHSLGVVPAEAVLEFTCLTAEQGYSVGDVCIVTIEWNGTTAGPIPSIWRNATQVGMAAPSAGYVASLNHKTTGVGFIPTAANWSYRFRLRKA